MQERTRIMKDTVGILPSDIIPIVKYAWDLSFARMESNKKAIRDRGWFPLNRNLLLHPEIRCTMTVEEKNNELKTGIYDEEKVNKKAKEKKEEKKASFECKYLPDSELFSNSPPELLNFSDPTANDFLTHLVREDDLMKTREKIVEAKKEGTTLEQRMKTLTKFSAGQMMTKTDSLVLGLSLKKEMESQIKMKKEEEERKKKRKKKRLTLNGAKLRML